MQHIIEGFLNFQKEIFPQRKELFRSLASSQNPKALFISCSDSRLVPELVTQQEPGQLFVIRNASLRTRIWSRCRLSPTGYVTQTRRKR